MFSVRSTREFCCAGPGSACGLLPEDAVKDLEPEEITGPGGLLTQLAGRVLETALGAELSGPFG